MDPDLNELGFYVLAGAPKTPADLPQEMAEGDALGFGSAFISERYNIKEAATLSGAAAVASQRLGIATGATNHNTRHPLITASYATTMHRLTGGPLHARARPRHRRAVLGLRHPEDHHRPDGGHRRRAAPTVARRGRVRSRRAGREVPDPAPGRIVRRRHPVRPRRLRPEHAGPRRAGLRHGRPPHVLHRRDDDARGRGRPHRGRSRPDATRRPSASGPATRPSPTPSPTTCG